jgi:hypothetical protein
VAVRRRDAVTVVVLSIIALVLLTGASFGVYHAYADAAATGGCGGG